MRPQSGVPLSSNKVIPKNLDRQGSQAFAEAPMQKYSLRTSDGFFKSKNADKHTSLDNRSTELSNEVQSSH